MSRLLRLAVALLLLAPAARGTGVDPALVASYKPRAAADHPAEPRHPAGWWLPRWIGQSHEQFQ